MKSKFLFLIMTFLLIGSNYVYSDESDFVITEAGSLYGYNGPGGDVVIPNSVIEIAGIPFGEKHVTSLTIPASVKYIGLNALHYMFDLTAFIVDEANTVMSSRDGVLYNKEQTVLWIYPIAKPDNAFIMPNTVTDIWGNAFLECNSLTSIAIPSSLTVNSNFLSSCKNLLSVAVAENHPGNSVRDGILYNSDQTGLCIYPAGRTGSFTIPESVTSIGGYAFAGCSGLSSIGIPNSVERIDGYAFERCGGLNSVEIPNSVKSIGSSAFSYCSNLVSITIPNSVESIGHHAFFGCGSLNSIAIPNLITDIGDYTFAECGALSFVGIPNSVENIGSYAFSKCGSLSAIVIPDKITSLSEGVFSECEGLNSVVIPSSVTGIGNSAFSGCSSLVSIAIPNSVTGIGEYAFEKCSSLSSVEIPNSVTELGIYSFSDCKNLQSAGISTSITGIGRYTFSGCEKLNSIVIPHSVTNIQEHAFYQCKSLAYILIPKSVETIGEYALATESALQEVTVEWDALPQLRLNNSVFAGANTANCKLRIPAGTLEAYQKEYCWERFPIKEEYELTGIGNISKEKSPVSVKFNPADNSISIRSNSPDIIFQGVRIYDMSGKLLVSRSLTNNSVIYPEELNIRQNGLYISEIITSGGIYRSKLIITNK
ncbi:MAG: leucine-rich repeat domain-containing protein [Dysgonamonadaceae bacterium]|jgi:hypothetical protein|nr:leucine-rich repeat domain-containing protein [Dysgonamonadaceae bacterium]